MSDEQILRATVAAIGKHGPAKLTLAHVAKECGLSPATLVQRFGSKAGLLKTVARVGADDVDEVFDEARGGTPVETLREALVALAADIRTRKELANHMAMLQLDLSDPELRRLAARQAGKARRRVKRLLELAVDEGHLRPHDTTRLAGTVHTVYNGALITWAVDGRGALGDWIRAHVDDVIAPYRVR